MKKCIIAAFYGGAIGWIVGTVIKTELENRKIRKRIKETARMLDALDKGIADLEADIKAKADKAIQEPVK